MFNTPGIERRRTVKNGEECYELHNLFQLKFGKERTVLSGD